ncbi:hypothetical protein KOW79_001945 [Hemibagrus wyckioides]|uniref:Uncharacterized protein n=1 Tax=Hemibagrus wyckioides TaxID=337641 RepID=A0A9D3P7C4_9TELE|nr:hypothetical protein KOW79_001945 [Hemibagrus wyckioides]
MSSQVLLKQEVVVSVVFREESPLQATHHTAGMKQCKELIKNLQRTELEQCRRTAGRGEEEEEEEKKKKEDKRKKKKKKKKKKKMRMKMRKVFV